MRRLSKKLGEPTRRGIDGDLDFDDPLLEDEDEPLLPELLDRLELLCDEYDWLREVRV